MVKPRIHKLCTINIIDMKKLNVTMLFLAWGLMGAISVHSQSVEFGFRYMPTLSDFSLKSSSGGTVQGKASYSFGAGAFLGINFSEAVGIQGEVIYSSLAQKYTDPDFEQNIQLRYVNVPILLSLNTSKTKAINLGIVGGPQFGFSVGSRLLTSGSSDKGAILAVKKNDFGLAYGAGLDIGLNPSHTVRLGLGYRGVYGLVDISDDSGTLVNESYYILDRTKVKTDAVYVGFSFLF